MTDNETLQKLFQAALKDTSEGEAALARAFPVPAPAVAVAVQASPAAVAEPVIQAPAAPVVNAGLDAATSAELGALLDGQHQRKTRKQRREALVTLIVVFALTGGGTAWFVQSPARTQAFREAVRDIRSIGDVTAMAGKYKAALDRIGGHSKEIGQATESMGASSNQDGMKDPNMDAEMSAMMGGDGKTTGQRNQLLQQKFGDKARKAPQAN